jgi:hypothetical protein
MYRIGGWKCTVAALLPVNAFALTKSGRTMTALRVILVAFEAFMFVWLVAMAVLAVAALVLRREVDHRTPRVALPVHRGEAEVP